MAARLCRLSFVLALTFTVAVIAPCAGAQTASQRAAAGIARLQSWYSPASGTWEAPSNWWNWANAVTVLAEYERVAGDRSYDAAIANTFRVAPGAHHHPDFENEFYDDMGWWALAWIEAYDATGKPAYLAQAETIFQAMTSGWDTTTCGGGLWWNTSKKYKNAIPNELFLEIAAKLANRTKGADAAGYLAWAQKEWSWFEASGMINASNLVNDGLDSHDPNACVNNRRTTWSYNQGVILGALVELQHASGEATLTTQAQAIADATLASSLVNTNGILVEPGVRGGDTPQFKGIFLRNLMALDLAAPRPAYEMFIQNNANSIWLNDRQKDAAFGALWKGPVDSADATRQTSALDCLIAAIAIEGQARSSAAHR